MYSDGTCSTSSSAGSVMVTVACSSHPLMSVTVMVYCPAANWSTLSSSDMIFPFSSVHWYEYGALVLPPVTIVDMVALLSL